MHTKLDQTGLSWFELATTNQKVDTDVILRCEYMFPHVMENSNVVLPLS